VVARLLSPCLSLNIDSYAAPVHLLPRPLRAAPAGFADFAAPASCGGGFCFAPRTQVPF